MILVEREPTADEYDAIQDAIMLGEINPTARLIATLWVVVAEDARTVVVRICKRTWVVVRKMRKGKPRVRWFEDNLPLDKLHQIMI